MVEHLGLVAVVIMVVSYAFEARHPVFVLIFAIGCALASFYAYLIGSIPFLIAEGIWAIVALLRYRKALTA